MTKIINLFIPVITLICLVIFKNIWNFKNYLKSKKNPNKILLRAYEYYFHKYGAFIGYRSEISTNIIFPHGYYGIFISNDAVLEDNIVIFQHVTIGSNTIDLNLKRSTFHSPIVGKDCYIGAGAKIIGGVKIGANCRVGANAVVYKDVPQNSVVVVSHTRIIQKEEKLDNRFFSYKENGLTVLNNGVFEEINL